MGGEPSPPDKDWNNLSCFKVRNTAYLTHSVPLSESDPNSGTSFFDHRPTEERICLTTRVITYLGAVSFFEDSLPNNTFQNSGGRAFLREKEPAFSFLLVLTKSECPCTLKVEATPSGYVVTKEQHRDNQGVEEREERSSGECLDNDTEDEDFSLAQDLDVPNSHETVNEILNHNPRADKNRNKGKERNDFFNQSQDLEIVSSQETDNEILIQNPGADENKNTSKMQDGDHFPNQSQDLEIVSSQDTDDEVLNHNLTANENVDKSNRKDEGYFPNNQNTLVSSEKTVERRNLSGGKDQQNSDEEELLSATKEKHISKENHKNVKYDCNNESDDAGNDISFDLSNDDEVPIVKKQRKPYVKRKKNRLYCIFCKSVVGDFSRHLRRRHKGEEQVKKLLKLDESSSSESIKEKKLLFNKLRFEGASYYNEKLLSESGSNEDTLSKLKFKKKPSLKVKLEDIVMCKYCKQLFSRKRFCIHVHKCDDLLKNGGDRLLGGRNIIKLCGQELYPPIDGASEELKNKILPNIHKDKFVLEAFSDKLIMSVVNKYFEAHKEKTYRHGISQKIRKGGKLVFNLKQKDSTIKEMKHCFHPSKFDLVAETVREMCFSNRMNGTKNETLEQILLWVINKAASKLLEDIMVDEESSEAVRRSSKKDINKFLVLFHEKMKSFKSNRNADLEKSSVEQKENNTIASTNLQSPDSNEQTSQSNPDESHSDHSHSNQDKEVVCEMIPKDIVPSVMDPVKLPIASAESSDSIRLKEPRKARGYLEKLESGCSEIVGNEDSTEENISNCLPLQQNLSSLEDQCNLVNFDRCTVTSNESDSLLAHSSRDELKDRVQQNEMPLDLKHEYYQLKENDYVLVDPGKCSDLSAERNKSDTNHVSPEKLENQNENCAQEKSGRLPNQIDIVHIGFNTTETCENHDKSYEHESEELQPRENKDEKGSESTDRPNLKQLYSPSKNTVEILVTDVIENLDNFSVNSTNNFESQLEDNIVQSLETTEHFEHLVEDMETNEFNDGDDVGKELAINEETLREKCTVDVDVSFNEKSDTGIVKLTEEGVQEKSSLQKPVATTSKIMGEHYCIFCKYLVRNFRRHVLQDHKAEEQVLHYFKLLREDKENTHKERSKILEDLCNEGDRIYAEIIIENPTMEYVMTSGLPEKQPGKRKPSQDTFKMCRRCKSLLSKKEFPDHICGIDEDQSESSDEEDYDKWIPKCKVAKKGQKRKSIKGFEAAIRKKWTDEERRIVIREFKEFIKNGTNPGTNRCRDLILKHEVLSGRTNLQLNTMIDNINRGKLKLPKEFQYLKN